MEQDTTPHSENKNVILKIIVGLFMALIAGVVVWNTLEIRKLNTSTTQDQNTTQNTQENKNNNDGEADADPDSPENDDWDTRVVSGEGGFELLLPDGWGPLLNVTDADSLIMQGTAQPTLANGSETKIQEIEGYGTDSLSLFSVRIGEPGGGIRGEESDFTLVNGKENPIEGKKYTYYYEEDEVIGIGYQRFRGDVDYVYIFETSDSENLEVYYSVYGEDPRNLSTTVEAIIDSIRVPAQ